LRVGCPWRDLPEYFGLWNTVYRRFLLWSRKDILLRLFKALSTDSDTAWECLEGRYIKAHQHSVDVAITDLLQVNTTQRAEQRAV
jgi:transposase